METTTRLILTGTLFASAGLAAIPPPLPRPPAESLTQFVKGLSGALTAYEPNIAAERGRAELPRLNAYEDENAVRDLLNVPWVQIKSKLPQDGESWRFNKIGAALDVSHVPFSRDMSSADYALREDMAAKLLRPPSAITHGAVTRIYACQEPSQRNYRPREGNTRTDRLSFPVLDSHAQPDVRAGRSPNTSEETKEREALGRVSRIFSDAGGFSWSSYRIPAPGGYWIRAKGYTISVSGASDGVRDQRFRNQLGVRCSNPRKELEDEVLGGNGRIPARTLVEGAKDQGSGHAATPVDTGRKDRILRRVKGTDTAVTATGQRG